jgi:hypothetical protein
MPLGRENMSAQEQKNATVAPAIRVDIVGDYTVSTICRRSETDSGEMYYETIVLDKNANVLEAADDMKGSLFSHERLLDRWKYIAELQPHDQIH